ncbi:ATP-binding protein [Methylorubrum populi]
MSAGNDVLGTAVIDPGMAADVDPFHSMRAGLPERSQRILRRLDVLENVYVECGRDRLLTEVFDRFMLSFLTRRNERRKEAEIFFLTGSSGAGKTAAMERVLRRHPALQPETRSFGVVERYVSVSLTGYVHPRILAEMIMDAAGARVAKVGRGEAWYRLAGTLQTRQVSLVHIDEFTHLMPSNGTAKDIDELANAIKGASISPTHLIAFVLSGLPRITNLLIADHQVERRNCIVEFSDLRLPDERRLVVRILKTMTEAIGMGIGNMADTDLPERVAHAGRRQYGRVCQYVSAAIRHALYVDPDASELKREHFALAYAERSLARGHNERNLFLADDWDNLPLGSYFRQEGEE